MPFIGNQPALSYTSFAKQDFTTSATTTYTLDNPVANANELALFINFVRQEPTTAYSASGTTLTLTEATSSSDDMYCVFLGKAVQTVNPPNASVGASQLVDASITSGKLASGVLPTNTPAFEAYLDNGTTPSNDVTTLVTFDVEKFDTASAYNTSTGKFQPQVAGKYFVYGSIGGLSNTNNGNLLKTATMIYLNGSNYRVADFFGESNQGVLHKRMSMPIASVLTLNGSSDYVQLYANIQTYTGGDVNIDAGDDKTFFGAYKIIE